MKRYIGRFSLLLFLLTVWLTAGCATGASPAAAPPKVSYTATDATGAVLRFDRKPARIVSLTISTDEILVGLAPPERIAGPSYLADDPGISNITAQSKAVPVKLRGDSVEAIVACRPDLVIAADFFNPDLIRSLRELGVKVYVYETQRGLDDVKHSIRTLAALVGEPQNAAALIGQMDRKLAEIRRKVGAIPAERQKRVVYLGVNGAYFNPRRAFHDICRLAGVRDATAELGPTRAGTVPKEEVVRLNPDAFIVADWNYDGKHETAVKIQEALDDPAWQTVDAVRNRQVIALPGAHLQSLSQYIVYAVEDMAKAIYPEAFGE